MTMGPDETSADAAMPLTTDYVVVGAGAAGCVLASRLSEDPDVTVLLVEAGGPNDGEEFGIPGLFSTLRTGLAAEPVPTTPQDAVAGRVVPLVVGRGLGGGTSINAMWWFQGQPEDYDGWEARGATGWGWRDVLPTLRRIEDHELGSSEHHGAGGPMAVTSPRHLHPLAVAFIEAGAAQGWPVSGDLNGAQRVGVGFPYSTIRDGVRVSAADGYLRPVLDRPNLTVLTGHPVDRIVIDDGRAVGAVGRVVLPGGGGTAVGEWSVRARRGVVLSAGAVRSPQLLMLSGVGPAEHLHEHGIEVVMDSPGVGADLQDHPAVASRGRCGTRCRTTTLCTQMPCASTAS